MRIVFIGPPGAGKGTQCARLVQHLQVPHLSTGEMLRDAKAKKTQLGKLATEYMDRGNLVPDPIIVRMVGERLEQPDCKPGCVFDGFPRTVGQAKSLDEYLEQKGEPLDIVLELKVDDREILSRLDKRREQLAKERADDQPDVIPQRLKQYRRQTMPLLEYYRNQDLLKTIDGLGTPDEVFARIESALDNVKKA